MQLQRLFLEHPRSVGETYLQHQRHAFGFGLRMIAAGAACLVHGIFPGMCRQTGSRAITQLNDRMVVNRVRQRDISGSASNGVRVA